RWLPAIVSAAIVPVFYWLSLRIFKNATKACIATTIVAVMPGTFGWLVMGGGLTRSFGILFFLLSIGNVLKLFRDQDTPSLWFSILFCGLAVLSHPEVGLQTAGICFLVVLVFGRSPLGLKKAFFVSVGTTIITAPWWIAVLLHHGLSPFVSAMQTGIHETFVASLFHSFFSLQGDLPIIPILSILGLFLTLRRKEYFLFGWAFLPFFLDPRNAPAITQYAYILLSSEALYFLWEKFNQAYITDTKKKGVSPSPYSSFFLALPFIALGTFFLVVTLNSSRILTQVSLKKSDQEVMEWVRTNMPVNGRFLLMTNRGQVNPMVDSFQEWFPTLTERHSDSTLQGREWTLGSSFYDTSLQFIELQKCRDVDCMQNWALNNNVQIEYVLVQVDRVSSELAASIRSDESFQTIYDSDTTIIYEYVHK
ncbi:MAG TPA: hypothetical protein VLA72_06620, partial [Anaerolineales bacterium]|nr:hypothetical protein [Anaerolineales bacterium]